MILFLNCHAFTFCIFSCMFDNFLKLTYLYAKVCLEMKILLQNCKLNLSNSFHSRTLDTSILLWNQNLYEVVTVFYSQGNSQPFNLYPDFWKLRSWEIKVFFKPEKNFRFCKPDFFFQVFTLKKSWVYPINLKKKSRFEETEIFLGF